MPIVLDSSILNLYISLDVLRHFIHICDTISSSFGFMSLRSLTRLKFLLTYFTLPSVAIYSFAKKGECCALKARLFGDLNLGTIYLRKGTRDLITFHKIFGKLEYDYDFHGKSLDSFEIIIDAGANIGLSTLYFLHKFPNASIYAIEPLPSNISLFCQNVDKYISAGRVTLIRGCLSDVDGVVQFESSLASDACSISSDDVERVNALEVQSLSFNLLCSRYCLSRVDFLKLDIEGGEATLLSSIPSLDSFVEWISLEIHSYVPGSVQFALSLERSFKKVQVIGENHYYQNDTLL